MFDSQALRSYVENGSQTFRENSVSYILYCPHCGKEKLYIRKRDGIFKCWVCAETQNFKGHAEYALTVLYGGKIDEYRQVLRGEVGGPLQRLDFMLADHWGEEEDFIETPLPLVDWQPSPLSVDCHDPGFEPGRAYLHGRGLTDAHIEKYGIRYSPWENRVQFPFFVHGMLVGWQGRLCSDAKTTVDAITGRERKVLKALTTIQDGVQGRYFMFGDATKGHDHIVLCEGPMDAIKADLCGANVSSLGKGVSPTQLEYIGARFKRMYVALDPDAADEMARLVRSKRMELEVYILPPPEGCKDLGEASPEAVFEEFQKARRFYPGQIIINVGNRLCF